MKKIMFCGGGSAGHVIPNVAIIECLNDYETSYLGTGAIEENICKANGIKFYKFDAPKLVRGKIICNLTIPFKLVKGFRQAQKIFDTTKPDLLFCKGGYVCLPAAFAAKKCGIKVLTHESDVDAGLANKLIAKKCYKVLTAFPSTSHKFNNGVYVGTPMRNGLFNRNRAEAKQTLGLDARPTLIVFGGGSGSKAINDSLRKIIFQLCKNINVIHICGSGNVIESTVHGYYQFEFFNDMGLLYACADAAVARCGANSANELIALRIPTLFIPLENSSSRGDQVKNAQYFLSKGLCRVLRERDLNNIILKNAIEDLMSDVKLKAALSASSIKCGNDNIVKEIKSALK